MRVTALSENRCRTKSSICQRKHVLYAGEILRGESDGVRIGRLLNIVPDGVQIGESETLINQANVRRQLALVRGYFFMCPKDCSVKPVSVSVDLADRAISGLFQRYP